jgi:hypothetical protein
MAVTISCLGIVRAQRFAAPDAGVTYKCSTGKACIEGTATGTPYGVYGTSSGGNGVEGRSSAAGRSGVSGVQLGSSGIGVYGESHDTTGKYAALIARADETTTNLFYGYNPATHASCLIDPNANLTCNGFISASSGILGSSSSGPGVYGVDTKNYGVEGVSGSSNGVYGSSTSGYGVYGVTGSASGGSAGVAGIAPRSSGPDSSYGVYGSSSSGPGVYGVDTSEGSGSSAAAGVYGTSHAKFGAGVVAISQGSAGTALSVYAEGGGDVFFGQGAESHGTNYCEIDATADLTCTGKVMGGVSFENRHRTSTGRHVLAFASESTSSTIEDFGTGSVIRGVANVQIEPTFASTIDRGRAYYVFLTPLGDTRGLYVSQKTPSGFQVRETQGGYSSLGFDYRIVAHPADAENARLPMAPAMKTPRTPHLNAAQEAPRQP